MAVAEGRLTTDPKQNERTRGQLDGCGVQGDSLDVRQTCRVQLDDITPGPRLSGQWELAGCGAGVKQQEERVVRDPRAARATRADAAAVEVHAERLCTGG